MQNKNDNPKNLSKQPLRHIGIHLSGPNSHKTSIVCLEGDLHHEPLTVVKVYEKIGSFGSLFSDDRIVEMIRHLGPAEEAFVDCPLTVPPCVACVRSSCPGVKGCEDITVAYMMHLASLIDQTKGKRRKPLNPQSQRLWDVFRSLQNEGKRFEPSYSANMAPLVTRARVLGRRLASLDTHVELYETSVGLVIDRFAHILGIKEALNPAYRNFEKGLEVRRALFERILAVGWINPAIEKQLAENLFRTVENFHGFIAALVKAIYSAGLTTQVSDEFLAAGEGWVYLPDEEALQRLLK